MRPDPGLSGTKTVEPKPPETQTTESPPPPADTPSPTGLAHAWHAFLWSMSGLRTAWREAAFRQEVALIVVLAPAGLWFGENGVERALLVGSLFLVLVVELLNSGVEAVVDRVGPERHPLSKAAKDLGSAAVFVSLCATGVVWLLVLL